MKTLHTKRTSVLGVVFLGTLEIMYVSAEIYTLGHLSVFGSVLSIAGLIFCLELVRIDIWVRSTHWVKYGEGKIIIRRVSKLMENGRPVGKWKDREDEFLLEQIELFGLSRLLLKKPLEYHRTVRYTEVFFKLKDGRTVEFVYSLYTSKQVDELFFYIYNETGMKMTEKLNKA